MAITNTRRTIHYKQNNNLVSTPYLLLVGISGYDLYLVQLYLQHIHKIFKDSYYQTGIYIPSVIVSSVKTDTVLVYGQECNIPLSLLTGKTVTR